MARLNKRSRGAREATNTDVSPTPGAEPSSGGGTPLAAVTTIETQKDVAPQSTVSSYATQYGYTYHDYDALAPNNDRVQAYGRILVHSPYGYHGVAPTAAMGYNRVLLFFTNLYDEYLRKAVRRDGYRHLPDTQDNVAVVIARDELWLGEVHNVRTVLQIIDSLSWNDCTKTMANDMSRKKSRATKAYADLSTIAMNNLTRTQALLHPVISDRPNGAIIFSLVNNYEWFGSFGTVTTLHPCARDIQTQSAITLTSTDIDNILSEAEAAVSILRNEAFVKAMDGDADGGFTWSTATGRGTRLDLKYWDTLINEIVLPTGLPEPGEITVDIAQFNQTLYGDAIYGVDHEDTTYLSVGYPQTASVANDLIYRRGFIDPSDMIMHAGMRQPWAVLLKSIDPADQTIFGGYAQIVESNSAISYQSNAYRLWSRVAGWYSGAIDTNWNDGSSMRTWLTDGSPNADHQWNEKLLSGQMTVPDHAPAGAKTYGFFQPYMVPPELLRSALCSAHNIPFVR